MHNQFFSGTQANENSIIACSTHFVVSQIICHIYQIKEQNIIFLDVFGFSLVGVYTQKNKRWGNQIISRKDFDLETLK
jgi:hypothetical protein